MSILTLEFHGHIPCMAEYPEAFTECHPEPHQCIDLSSRRTGA